MTASPAARRGGGHALTLPAACYIPTASAARTGSEDPGPLRRPTYDARSRESHEVVFRDNGRRRCQLPRRGWRDPRLPRTERGREDDHDADDHGVPRRRRRDGSPWPASTSSPGRSRPSAISATSPRRSRSIRRCGSANTSRTGRRLCGVPRRDAASRVGEALETCFVDGRRRQADREPLERLPAAGRPRRRRSSTGPMVLVLDEPTVGPRSAPDHEGARADPGPEEGPHDPPLDAHPSRGRASLRPDPHHRPREDRRAGDAGDAPAGDGAASGARRRPEGGDLRGGRRAPADPGRRPRLADRRRRRDARPSGVDQRAPTSARPSSARWSPAGGHSSR